MFNNLRITFYQLAFSVFLNHVNIPSKKNNLGILSYIKMAQVSPFAAHHLRFLHRHADSDLQNLINTTVPPLDVSKVMVFNSHLLKFAGEVVFQLGDLNRFVIFLLWDLLIGLIK